MATYALLAAGENPQDPRLAKAIDWLLDSRRSTAPTPSACGRRSGRSCPTSTRSARRSSAAIKRDRDILHRRLHKDPKNRRSSRLLPATSRATSGYRPEQSASTACSACGPPSRPARKCPTELLGGRSTRLEEAPAARTAAGTTSGDGRLQATMTAAGVATLFITQDYLLDLKAPLQRATVQPEHRDGPGLDGPARRRAAQGRQLLRAVRRRAHRRRQRPQVLRHHDWYEVGADYLVKNQSADGSWGDEDEHHNARSPQHLLRPLLPHPRPRPGHHEQAGVQADYAKEGQGDRLEPAAARPGQLRQVDGQATSTAASSTGRSSTSRSNADDLHDAPILYIAGSEPLSVHDGGRRQAAAVRRGRRADPRQRRLRQAERSPRASRTLGKQLFPTTSSASCRRPTRSSPDQQFNADQVEDASRACWR